MNPGNFFAELKRDKVIRGAQPSLRLHAQLELPVGGKEGSAHE